MQGESDEQYDFTKFTTEQRVWLVERELREFARKMSNLEGVLNRILWVLITLLVTVLGSVVTFLIAAAG